MNILIPDKPYYLYYVWFILIIILMMSLFTFPEALDIGRYYEDALTYSKIYTLPQYFEKNIDGNIDFIYTCSLFIFAQLGLPLNIVTIFFLSLYYISLCEIIRISEPTKVHGVLLIVILLFCPFIWVLAISRNAAAIAIYYFAILQFVNRRPFLGITFFIVSIFTHVSMIMWIIITIIAYAIRRFHLKKFIIISILVGFITLAYIIPNYLFEIMSLILGNSESRYVSYSIVSNVSSPLHSTDISYGEKIPMLYSIGLSIYLLIVNQKQNFYYWMLFLLTIFLSFAIFSSMMFTNRTIMIMPLYIGYNICSIINMKNFRINMQLYMLSIIGCGSVFLHFWSRRSDLFGL